MKKYRITSTFLVLVFLMGTGTQLKSQTDSVSIGAGYAQQVWYSMENGKVKSEPINNWDLAFQVPGFESSILVNSSKADFVVYQSPYEVNDWGQVDTAGMSDNWIELHNSTASWTEGALNHAPVDEFDFGWGTYNQVTHVVEGDSVYVLFTGQSWKKLKIDRLSGGVYEFTYANLDGSNEVTQEIDKNDYSGKNFAYFSIDHDEELDREPSAESWDLTFSQYIEFVPMPYSVSGVRHNLGVEAAQIDNTPHDEADYSQAFFYEEINTIGNDWKSINMQTFQWEIDSARTYFVKDQEGTIWKLYFTGFGGSSNGNYYFSKSEEVTSSAPDRIQESMNVNLFPNPVNGGNVNVEIESEDQGEIHLQLYSLSGQMITERKTGLSAGFSREVLNVSAVPSGMYIVVVETGKERITRKITVQN